MALRTHTPREAGFSLVEVMVVVILLGLVAALVYVGAKGSVRISEAGKAKAEAVAVMKAVAEDLSGRISELAISAGAGELDYAGSVAIPPRYEAKYTLSSAYLGTWRLELRVVRDGDTLASDALLLQKSGH